MSTILQRASTFAEYAKLARAEQVSIPKAEVDEAADKFGVSPTDVHALRDELLAQASAQGDAVGEKTKNLRQNTLGGTFQGQPTGKGIGVHAARLSDVGASQSTPDATPAGRADGPAVTGLPAGLDVQKLAPTWGVNLSAGGGSETLATATFEAGDHQLHVDLAVRGPDAGRARVGFFSRDMLDGTGSVEIEKHPLNPALATELAVALETAIANNPGWQPGANSGPGYAMEIAGHVVEACNAVALPSAPSAVSQKDAITAATHQFDAGDYKGAIAAVKEQASSPHPSVRGFANFVLAELSERTGDVDGALQFAALAGLNLGSAAQFHVSLVAARCHRAKGDWEACTTASKRAVHLGEFAQKHGDDVKLGPAYFGLAVARKNTGDIGGAIDDMKKAVAAEPDSTAYQLALAGYLAIDGRKDEATTAFSAIPEPPVGTHKHLDFHTNATWFSALMDDKPALLDHASKALAAAEDLNYPSTVHYFESETDLEKFRADPEFRALLDAYHD